MQQAEHLSLLNSFSDSSLAKGKIMSLDIDNRLLLTVESLLSKRCYAEGIQFISKNFKDVFEENKSLLRILQKLSYIENPSRNEGINLRISFECLNLIREEGFFLSIEYKEHCSFLMINFLQNLTKTWEILRNKNINLFVKNCFFEIESESLLESLNSTIFNNTVENFEKDILELYSNWSHKSKVN
jgi:hypothetical protein